MHLVAVATVPVMLSNLTTSCDIFCNNIAVHSGKKEKSRRGQFVHVNSAQRTEFFPREPVSTTAVGAPSSAQNGSGKNQRDALQKQVPKGVWMVSTDIDMTFRGCFGGPLRNSSDEVGDPIFARTKCIDEC